MFLADRQNLPFYWKLLICPEGQTVGVCERREKNHSTAIACTDDLYQILKTHAVTDWHFWVMLWLESFKIFMGWAPDHEANVHPLMIKGKFEFPATATQKNTYWTFHDDALTHVHWALKMLKSHWKSVVRTTEVFTNWGRPLQILHRLSPTPLPS